MQASRFAFFGFVLGVTSGALAAAGTATTELSVLVKEWTTRQQKTNAVYYELSGKRLIPKGEFSAHLDTEKDVPETDVVFDENAKLIIDFDNNWFRLEVSSMTFQIPAGKFRASFEGLVYDGTTLREFQPRDKVEKGEYRLPSSHPDLYMHEVKFTNILYTFGWQYLPVFSESGCIYNSNSKSTERLPLRRLFSLSHPGLEIKGEAVVQGRNCLIVKSPLVTYWVDVDRGGIIPKATIERAGDLITIDVQHREKDGRWMTTGWTYTEFYGTSPKISTSVQFKIHKAEINPHLRKDDFQDDPTPGMLVKKDKGKYFRVLESGEFKEVSFDDGTDTSRLVTVLIVIGVLLSAILVIGWRLRKKGVTKKGNP